MNASNLHTFSTLFSPFVFGVALHRVYDAQQTKQHGAAHYNVTFACIAIYPYINIKYTYMEKKLKTPTHIIMHELHKIHFKVRQLIRYSATLNYYYFLLRAVNKMQNAIMGAQSAHTYIQTRI